MSHAIETFTVGALRVSIELDAESPDFRDGGGSCSLVLFGKARSYGDQHDHRSEDYTGWADMRQALERANPGGVVRPVYLMDHSGVSLATDDSVYRAIDPQAWDWCQVGWAVASAEDIRESFLRERITEKLRRRAEELVDVAVEFRSRILQGEVYAYVVRDASGEVLDSCSGIVGFEHAVAEARAAAEALI